MSGDTLGLSETELYDKLQKYILPVRQLGIQSYPCPDPDVPGRKSVPLCKFGRKQQLRPRLLSSYTCCRCNKFYQLDSDGSSLPSSGVCIYHPGKLFGYGQKRYGCCQGFTSAAGCRSNRYHVHENELELKNYEGYVKTELKFEREPNRHGIYALDCEMCYTIYGLELCRVTIVNHKHSVVYDSLVRPENKILDVNTYFTGITKSDMDKVSKSLVDVQRDLLDLFSSKTILIGHGMNHDMSALKMFHENFIDTAQVFPHPRGLPFKRGLKKLMEEKLKVVIQNSASHDSKEDAIAALRLVMWKLSEG